ncbi:MAG: ATP-binding cassette domain-containing protein [Flavonifractor plautii]
MSEQKQPSIEIEHFSFYYPERTEKTLDDLTLTVEQGEFLVLCGPSGCGKSTLLRQLKTVLAPHGRRLGSIRFEGRPLEELDQRGARRNRLCAAGCENSCADKVWHELAFGLESLGYDIPSGAG